MTYCPKCGELSENEIQIHSEKLRKQSFNISPILPVCRCCGTKVDVKHICNGGSIIILTGTCGSGKSTIAEILSQKGFFVIDGDCVIQAVRHKSNRKQYDWDEL